MELWSSSSYVALQGMGWWEYKILEQPVQSEEEASSLTPLRNRGREESEASDEISDEEMKLRAGERPASAKGRDTNTTINMFRNART